MKKFLFLTLLFSAIIATTQAQTGGGPATVPQQTKEADPAVVLQQMKDKIRPLMVEKTGLTDEQANKVIEINFETRQAAGALRDLDEAERSKKIAELKAAREKKLNDLLTPEQLKAVNTFYEDMGKNSQPKSRN